MSVLCGCYGVSGSIYVRFLALMTYMRRTWIVSYEKK